jgi:hypothetical protein
MLLMLSTVTNCNILFDCVRGAGDHRLNIQPLSTPSPNTISHVSSPQVTALPLNNACSHLLFFRRRLDFVRLCVANRHGLQLGADEGGILVTH